LADYYIMSSVTGLNLTKRQSVINNKYATINCVLPQTFLEKKFHIDILNFLVNGFDIFALLCKRDYFGPLTK